MKFSRRMMQCVLLICFFLLPKTTVLGQVDPELLRSDIEKMRSDWNIPGMAVGVIHDGRVVIADGFGYKHAYGNDTVTANTNFAIASNTKAFIATAIGMLVEEGKIEWDDPVRKYLPYFRLYDPCVSGMTTIVDLLCHRVGLGTFSGDVIWYKSNYTAEEVIRRAAGLPQKFPFRDGYGYSNLMYIAAGEVIRAVTGQPWDVFVHDRILVPAQMDQTFCSVDNLEKGGDFATPHKPVGTKNKPISWVNWDNSGAGGGIISNVHDMLKWLQVQLGHGILAEDTLFSRPTQIKLWTPHNNFAVSDQSSNFFIGRHFSGYGLGWGLADYQGRKIIYHGGGYDGMFSRVVICPEENLGIVILTNTMKTISSPLGYDILDRFLGVSKRDWIRIEKKLARDRQRQRDEILNQRFKFRRAGTIPDLKPEEMAGLYQDPMYGPIEVVYANDLLELVFPNAPGLNATLSHWHFNTYKINWKDEQAWFDWGTVQFVLNNNGVVERLRFDIPSEDIFFDEIDAVKADH